MNIRKMARASMFAALMAVCAWIAIPIPPVSFTLQTFAVLLALGVLGGKWGTVSIGLYLLLGMVGLPVFTGFRGGPGVLLEATGGFLWGFLLGGFLCRLTQPLGQLPALLAAQACCWLCGCLWFRYYAGCSLWAAFLTCVAPYLATDGIKLWLALLVSKRLARFAR